MPLQNDAAFHQLINSNTHRHHLHRHVTITSPHTAKQRLLRCFCSLVAHTARQSSSAQCSRCNCEYKHWNHVVNGLIARCQQSRYKTNTVHQRTSLPASPISQLNVMNIRISINARHCAVFSCCVLFVVVLLGLISQLYSLWVDCSVIFSVNDVLTTVEDACAVSLWNTRTRSIFASILLPRFSFDRKHLSYLMVVWR